MIPKSVLSFDELNKLIQNEKSLPFEQYFGEMSISEESKKLRIALAEEFEVLFIEILAEEFYSSVHGEYLTEQYMYDAVLESYKATAQKFGIDASYRAEIFARDFARATVNHANEPYFVSGDRARYNAENESNTLFNGYEYNEAIKSRYKYKTWVAIIDNVTRDSHVMADGQKVEIDMPFRVGGSLMLYPKDESLGASPEEIINCRCSVIYS